jgi:hypothetical protein
MTASFVVTAQEKKLTWDYPVKPGSVEWQRLSSLDEIYEACQIPDNILKKIDTESLVQICFNYPASPVLFSYNSPQAGFNVLYSNFNGIRELLERKDVGHFMLNKYCSMSFKNDFNPLWKLGEQGAFVFKVEYFEIFLCQTQVIQSLDTKERKLLMKAALDKFDEKVSKADLFGGSTLAVNAWILARLLNEEDKLESKFPEMEYSIESGLMIDHDLQSIYTLAKMHTNEK